VQVMKRQPRPVAARGGSHSEPIAHSANRVDVLGACGLSSSLWRSQATCTSMVLDETPGWYSQGPFNSSSRQTTLPRRSIR
jgi:hypothetical protein